MSKCKEQGYHEWSNPDRIKGHQEVDSMDEDYEQMTLSAECARPECKATWEGTGDWEGIEEDEE